MMEMTGSLVTEKSSRGLKTSPLTQAGFRDGRRRKSSQLEGDHEVKDWS